MSDYAELEISLHRSLAGGFDIDLRVLDHSTEAQVAPTRGTADISLDKLSDAEDNIESYGRMLSGMLFGDPVILQSYLRHKTSFDSRGIDFRFRILIGPSAPELNSLWWELLLDPDSNSRLSTSERILFSRFMVSRDWRAVKIRSKSRLKAVVAVFAPADLAKFRLSDVDREAETSRVVQSLAAIQSDMPHTRGAMTVDHLMAAIRPGCDILYLVCHGSMQAGEEAALFFEDGAGNTAIVSASALAKRIAELPIPPRLIVLASCDSAAELGSQAHCSLAPLLADAGVPAVIAMMGKITMETVKVAMPVFFQELSRDGQIDRALAVARGAVRTRPDAWRMALFLRLKSGHLWYEPGFGGESQDEFKKWAAIVKWVRLGQFVPILGPELGEDIFGGTREIASRLADDYGFPLSRHDRTDLAKVTQFISIDQDRNFALDAVQNQFLRQLAEHSGGAGPDSSTLSDLLNSAVQRCRSNADHPYSVLSELDAPIYVNTSPEPLLFLSLKNAGRTPEAVVGPWRKLSASVPVEPQPANPAPSAANPWVYHVFGIFGPKTRDTMVLTEDDFFDYLIATSTDKLMPKKIRGALNSNALLLLGFRLDDWRFRVLFRMIMTMQGAESLCDFSHVGVQVSPEEHDLADVRRSMKYMESYFLERKAAPPSISIYWGSASDFLKELRQRLRDSVNDDPQPVATALNEEWI